MGPPVQSGPTDRTPKMDRFRSYRGPVAIFAAHQLSMPH